MVGSAARVAALEKELAEARPENTYLCNETHHRALKALDGGPRAAYFVHLPYAAEDDADHRRLSKHRRR